MMGIGTGEMILIAAIALIVFGPEKFPDFAKIVIRTVNDLRGYVDEIQKEVTKEIKPIKRELEQMSKYNPEKYIDALSKDVKKVVESTPSTSTSAESRSSEKQVDSKDCDASADTNSSVADPYDNLNDTCNDDSSAAPPENEPIPVVEGEAESSKETSAVDSSDDLDFSVPPVERLD